MCTVKTLRSNVDVYEHVELNIFGYSGPRDWSWEVHGFLREHLVGPLFNIVDPITMNIGLHSGDY